MGTRWTGTYLTSVWRRMEFSERNLIHEMSEDLRQLSGVIIRLEEAATTNENYLTGNLKLDISGFKGLSRIKKELQIYVCAIFLIKLKEESTNKREQVREDI